MSGNAVRIAKISVRDVVFACLCVGCCLAATGCRKIAPPQDAKPSSVTPERWARGLELLAAVESNRLEQAVTQVRLARLREEDDIARKRLSREQAALEDELAVMKEKYRAAKQEPEWRLNYGGMGYSEESFKALVREKLAEMKEKGERLKRYDVRVGEYARAMQNAEIRKVAQAAKESRLLEDIREIKRGRDLDGINKRWDNMDGNRLDDVSGLILQDVNDSVGLLRYMEREAAVEADLGAAATDADAFLDEMEKR